MQKKETMVGALGYSAAQASVRAGMDRLLPQEIWSQLLGAASLEGIVEVLLGTSYADALADVPASIEEVERVLQGYRTELFHMPVKFLQGTTHRLVDWLWRHFEVDNLITVVRAVHHGESAARIRASLVPLGPATEINWHAVSVAGSLDGVIDWLSASHHTRLYARALELASGEYHRQGNPFVLEIALYLAYYRRLQSLVRDLRGADRRDANLFVGTILDGRNLLWAYRYRIFFDLSAEEILGYTLHRGIRVDAEIIRRIAADAPLAQVVASIWDRGLPGMSRLGDLSPGDALVELEIILQRRLFALAARALHAYPLRLAVVLGYIVLVESELDDIITIIEGVTSGWPERRIRPYLIGARAGP